MIWDFKKIPPELKALQQWVCWAVEVQGGKPTKVPKDPKNGGNAMVNAAGMTKSGDKLTRKIQEHTADQHDGDPCKVQSHAVGTLRD